MSCIGGGNFEVDPRTSETSYGDISKDMEDTKSVYFGDSWLNPNLATYGNYHVSFILLYFIIMSLHILFMYRTATRENTLP